jgi:sodium-dependent dicarboxylate transporter 2/3/5
MNSSRFFSAKPIGLAAGLVLFVVIATFVPETVMPQSASRLAAVALLMASLWMSEALPIGVTALLPIILFPLLDIMPISQVTPSYAHHLVFLFLGGFWIAAAIEVSGLHRRIALLVLRLVGTRMDRLVLGFMAATAFLSMWLSNTATTMMMLPIALTLVQRVSLKQSPFGLALMLGIAYSASIGGVATLIGTPPNAILAGVAETTLGISISFAQWMLIGLPLSLVMLMICWWYLTRVVVSLKGERIGSDSTDFLQLELQQLGPMRTDEKRVLTIFSLVAFLWIFKAIIPLELVRKLDDSLIAMAGAIALFLLPSAAGQGKRLLEWPRAVAVPWEVLLLFGGGFALAAGFEHAGLTAWIGTQFSFLQGLSWLLLILIIAMTTIFLTEMTSNTATASMLLPVTAGVAVAMSQDALPLMAATALAASFAFMLPVATPPNAIVFASRQITIISMVKAGFWMNLIGLAIIMLAVAWLMPLLW